MKKTTSIILACIMLALAAVVFTSCGDNKADKIIVNTNAYFAPFEYYDGTEIVGVDVDIMNKVGEKLGKEVQFDNTEFAVIIDNVEKGEVCDCGAAGITITEARAEKVDFSIPYYTSVQFLIFKENDETFADRTAVTAHALWNDLAGKTVGVQTDTTGMIFAEGECGEGGVLEGAGTEIKNFDNAQLAADAISNSVDFVIIDELPAKYIVEKNTGLRCLPLYYKGAEGEDDYPTEEQYAICVTKGNTELLNAINEVLTEMLKEDESTQSEVIKLVLKHMGF